MSSPKVIFLDTSDRVHASDFSSCTNQLDSHVCSNLDDRVFVVGELWGRSIWVEFDIRRN